MTKIPVETKQWNRPELVRLGRIADVAGGFGVGVEHPSNHRS